MTIHYLENLLNLNAHIENTVLLSLCMPFHAESLSLFATPNSKLIAFNRSQANQHLIAPTKKPCQPFISEPDLKSASIKLSRQRSVGIFCNQSNRFSLKEQYNKPVTSFHLSMQYQ